MNFAFKLDVVLLVGLVQAACLKRVEDKGVWEQQGQRAMM